jgi:hypothetical protein
MKRRWHLGWVLFAITMVWSECLGDVPKILFPNRTTPAHLFIAITNVTAVTGLALYAFQLTGTRAFWRVYAPIYAIIIAAQFGVWMPLFILATAQLMNLQGLSFLSRIGVVAVTLPLLAMTMYCLIALFRLGDWIGPTRRPVGQRPQQLSLPI